MENPWKIKVGASFVFFLCLTINCSAGAAKHPLEQWNWRNPHPPAITYRDIAFHNGTYVLVGHNVILSSTNASNWVPRIPIGRATPALTQRLTNLLAVTYGAGRFVAMGDQENFGGLLMTSTDGVQWTNHTTGTNGFPYVTSVIYTQNVFVAAASSIMTSIDGLTWTGRVVEGFPGLVDVTYGNGRWVAVGVKVAQSTDATNWTSHPAPERLVSVAYGNGIFLALSRYGTPYTSPDGMTWTAQAPAFEPSISVPPDVAFGDGLFAAVAGWTNVYTSTDGVTWSTNGVQAVESRMGNDLVSIRHVGGDFVAVGFANVVRSSNGVDWAAAHWGSHDLLRGVAYGNGIAVAVGQRPIGSGSIILSSSNGMDWTQRFVGGGITPDTTITFNDVTFGAGLFAAVGHDGSPVVTSADGINWTVRRRTLGPEYLNGITYGDGKFVAVGYDSVVRRGSIFVSTDGINWTWLSAAATGTTNELFDVAYGNGIYLAVGGASEPVLLRSTDALTWTVQEAVFFEALGLRGIAFGQTNFVVVSDRRHHAYSSIDGLSWAVNSGSSGFLGPKRVSYGGGTFVISCTYGEISTSVDGTSWQRRASPANTDLHDAAYATGTWILVGAHGTILQSDDLRATKLSPPRIVGNDVQVTMLGGEPGSSYVLEVSNDLSSWGTAQGFQPTGDETVVTHFEAAGQGQRFYRAVKSYVPPLP